MGILTEEAQLKLYLRKLSQIALRFFACRIGCTNSCTYNPNPGLIYTKNEYMTTEPTGAPSIISHKSGISYLSTYPSLV